MSKYDKEREKMGLKPLGSSSSVSNPNSKYAKEREAIFSGSSVPTTVSSPMDIEMNQLAAEKRATVTSDPRRLPSNNLPRESANVLPQLQQKGTDKVDDRGKVEKALDWVFQENPVARVINYPFAKAAEYSIPDSPMIGQPGTSAREEHAKRNPVASTGNETLDTVLGGAGQVGSYFLNPAAPGQGPMALYNALDNLAATRLMNKATEKITSNLGRRVANEAAKEGLTGALYAAPNSLLQGDTSIKEIAGNVALEGAIGAAGGAGLPILGAALRKFAGTKVGESLSGLVKRKSAAPEAEKTVQEILYLPAPKETPKEILRGNPNRAVTPDVIEAQGDIYQSPILALPAGLTPQRIKLKVAGNTETLNHVMTQIKPEVEAMITPPKRRDLLIDYVQRNLGVPKEEVWNMPMTDLEELGQAIRESISVYDVAKQVATKRGYNLDDLLNNRGQGLQAKIHQDAKKQAYGVFNAPKINIQNRPRQSEVTGEVLIKQAGFKRVDPQVQAQPQAHPVSKYAAEREAIQKAQKPTIAVQQVNQVVETTPLQQTPVQATRQPQTAPEGMRERGFTTTLRESEKVQQGLRERLSNMYTPISNEEAVTRANKRVSDNIEEAVDYVTRSRVMTSEHVATAHRLIDEFQKMGNFERANDIADRIAELGTKAGQSIQAFSIYNRLSPEGILVHANRMAQRVNEKLPKVAQEVKVTEDMAAQLTELAGTVQKMTGVRHAADEIMAIMEKAKNGETLNDIETQTIKRFVNEARQFVKETDPKKRAPRMQKPPKELDDKRVRDNVISFLEAQEKAAKDRLRAKGIQISSMPLDIYADYALIGATKLAKGTIKFVDWSEEMVKELGEQVRPILADLYEKAQDTLSLSTKRITTETISQAEKIATKAIQKNSLEGAEAEAIRALAQRVSGLSGDAKRIASQDLQAVLNNIDKPSVLTKISSFQTMMQLLNPKTLLVRNPLGNELFYRLERMTKFAATPIDWARVKVFGGQRSVTFRTHNQGEYWSNFIKGVVAGWKGVNPEGLTTQYDIRGQAFNGKWNPLTYMEKALGASLKGFDYAAYKRAVNHTLGEMATLRAINEGLSGELRNKAIQRYIREADENILRIADEYGKYVTFQDNNMISVGLQKFKRGLNFGKEWGIGDLVIKYPRTPGALVMRALEYSPVGFLRSAYVAANPFFKKDPNTREAVMALMRGSIGTFGLSGFGYFLLDKGILTGAASKDKDIRELQRQAGQGQYQVNIDAFKRFVQSGFNPNAAKLQEGDLLYTYDWAQPVAIALSMGANMKKNILDTELKEGKKLDWLNAGYRSAEGGLNTLVEQSVLSGVKRAFEGYPGQTVMDKVVDILADVPASFAPTLGNQINQVSDNTRRETYSPNKLDESMNRLKARIPGLSQTLPQKYDTLGNPQPVMQDNNWFNVFLNPGYANRYKLTPEAKFVVELINETGDTSVAPRVPGKTLNVRLPGNETETIKLTTEQYSRLQQLMGEFTQRFLDKVNPDASSSAQLKQAAKALNDAGELARRELKKELGVR